MVVTPPVEIPSEPEEQKEVFHETVYQKLEGPKIMGKIELPVVKAVSYTHLDVYKRQSHRSRRHNFNI